MPDRPGYLSRGDYTLATASLLPPPSRRSLVSRLATGRPDASARARARLFRICLAASAESYLFIILRRPRVNT